MASFDRVAVFFSKINPSMPVAINRLKSMPGTTRCRTTPNSTMMKTRCTTGSRMSHSHAARPADSRATASRRKRAFQTVQAINDEVRIIDADCIADYGYVVEIFGCILRCLFSAFFVVKTFSRDNAGLHTIPAREPSTGNRLYMLPFN